MRRLNKRGFWMGEESGKFILGVIAVVLLFLLAFKLAGIMRQNTQYEQAKYTMSLIEEAISSVKDGETKTVFVESPKGWYLVAFRKELTDKPVMCGSEDCFCLCPEGDKPNMPTKKSCEREGVCRTLKETSIIPMMCGKVLNCLKFEKVPLLLAIRKTPQHIIIGHINPMESLNIFAFLYNSKELDKEIEEWTFNDRKGTEEMRKIIVEYMKEREDVENWYLSLAKINNGEIERRDVFGRDRNLAFDRMLGKPASLNWRGLIDLREGWSVVKELVSGNIGSPEKGISETELGGEWIAFRNFFERDSVKKEVLIEFRVDIKQK
jgi:hypothetical protein